MMITIRKNMIRKSKNSYIVFTSIGLISVIGSFLIIFILARSMQISLWVIAGVILSGIFILVAYGTMYIQVIYPLRCLKQELIDNPEKFGYRLEKYVIHRWKQPSNSFKQQKSRNLKNRRGRRSPTPIEDKICAIEKWEAINRRIDPVSLEEFLASEFGTSGGMLNVSKRTFYDWRSKFGHLINPENNEGEK